MKLILLSLAICLAYAVYTQKETKIDSIITSKTIVKLEDAKTIFKDKKIDTWDKYSNGAIAALTIFVSLGISVWQARSSRKHTKANIISEARVEWIQKLRPHLGELISDISKASVDYNGLKENCWDENTNQLKKNLSAKQLEIYQLERDKIRTLVYNIAATFNQVKLFLNSEEQSHINLINAVENFMNTFMETKDSTVLENDLIEKAQIVLKNAWEQAKT